MDLKKIDFDKIEEGGAVISYVKRHWQRGQLTMVKFLGLSGLGKSYASMRTAELLAKEIHNGNYQITRKNIIKNLLQLIRFIREVKQPGEIIVIEEMSVLFPSRRAMSGINVDANAIIDTIRKKGIIILCNYPLNHTVDSHIEAMCCLQIVTIQLNKSLGICLVYPLRLQTNPMIPKTYYHKLETENGDEIDYIFFRKPSEELIKPYEEEKDKLMDRLYEKLEARENLRQEKLDKELGKINRKGGLKDLTKRQMEIYNYIFLQKKTLTVTANELGITPQAVVSTLKVIKSKIEREDN